MQITKALQTGQVILKNSPTANLDCRLLLAHLLGCEPAYLFTNNKNILSAKLFKEFLSLINRRKKQEPIAYIIGKKEFYGLEFLVDRTTLIPRPDTELLVDLAKDILTKHSNQTYQLLELGTGSGALAVAIVKEVKNAMITATDISASALKVAKANIEKHQVTNQVKLIKSNWYQTIPAFKYDLIISNPPYICKENESSNMAAETMLFEPNTALYATHQGLANYHLIIKQAKEFLQRNGHILFEIGHLQATKLVKLLEIHHFVNIKIIKDLAGLDRAISGNLSYS